MRIELDFADLHGPLFIGHDNGGTNFGNKLYWDARKNKKPLEEFYLDKVDDVQLLVVKFKGQTSYVQSWNSVTIRQEHKPEVVVPQRERPLGVKAQVGGPNDVRTAQVSTPLDKVQGKLGRKAKFQGENQGEA